MRKIPRETVPALTSAEHLLEIETAAGKITVEGATDPENLEAMTGR